MYQDPGQFFASAFPHKSGLVHGIAHFTLRCVLLKSFAYNFNSHMHCISAIHSAGTF